jgi:Domain of unknown function (DUF4852)
MDLFMSRKLYSSGLFYLTTMALGFVFCATASADQSFFFDHNGSRVRLNFRGDRAFINYAEPRSGLAAAGIGVGSLLFEGRIGANGLVQGTAYTFASGCAPAPYAVNGTLREGQMVLTGAAPRRMRGRCEIAQYVSEGPHSLLVFNLIGGAPDTFQPAVPIQPISTPPSITQSEVPTTTPAAPAQVASKEPPNSEYDRLLDAYLSDREMLTTDPDFARAFAQFTNCAAYVRLRNNEFERERFNSEAPNLLKGREISPRKLHLRLAVKMGAYDFGKQTFAFKPLAQDSVYEVAAPRDYGCGVRYPTLPEAFAVRFENYDLVDGIPMAPEEAERLVKGRIGPTGLRDDSILMDVDIEFVGRVGNPADIDTGGFAHLRRLVSSVSGRIVDYALFSNSQSPGPFARLSAERKSAYNEGKAQLAAEEAADAKQNQAFSWALLSQQFSAIKTGPPNPSDKRTRFSSTGNLARDVSNPDGTRFKITPLAPGFSYEQRDTAGNRFGQSLQFVNPNPIDSVDLPAELAKRVSDSLTRVTLNRLYIPVGVIDDEAAGRSVVMAQIVGLEIEVHEGERRFRHLVPVPGELKPFVFQRDERPANAFEIMGLKVGLDPQDFIGIAAARFGAIGAYDPATRILRTAGTDCAAWPASGLNQQPCVAADFDVIGHGWFGGETIGLTRLSISQNVDYNQLDGFVAGFIKQFGEPRVRSVSGNSMLLSWGAVVSRQRDGTNNLRAGWHVVEIEIRQLPTGVATRFLLTDPAFFSSRRISAAPQNLSKL